jgi:hypothetical protein
MLLLSQGCCFIQSQHFSYKLQEDSLQNSNQSVPLASVRMTWYSVRTLFSQQHPSGRQELSVQMPINVYKLRTIQVCICPNVMANRLDALQISRRSQCSSESVRATWLYRPDAIQCLTSIRVSALRHNYGKTAATVRTMSDPVRRCPP